MIQAVQEDPTDPPIEAAVAPRIRWKWLKWVDASVVISSVALIVSAISAYASMLYTADEISILRTVGLTVEEETGRLFIDGNLQVTIINSGNRSAIVPRISGFVGCVSKSTP